MITNRVDLTQEQLKADREWFNACATRYYANMSIGRAQRILEGIGSKEKKQEFINKINNAKKTIFI